ncbi:hypothetical protein LCGC14_2297620, partial [marine sediment metagenome]
INPLEFDPLTYRFWQYGETGYHRSFMRISPKFES